MLQSTDIPGLFHVEFGKIRATRNLPVLLPSNVTTGAPAPADLHGPDIGDDICCDGRLVEAHDLTVDDVALTGESAPVHRTAEAVPAGTATMDAANLVFMGTSVVEGIAAAVAFATGADTQFGRIYTRLDSWPNSTAAASPADSAPFAVMVKPRSVLNKGLKNPSS
jgi:hypothetical protein